MSIKNKENVENSVKDKVKKLEVSVDEKTFKQACEKSYRKNCKNIRVPGFRVGKAPKKVVEKLYGAEIFYEDAIKFVYKKSLDDAIEKSKLDVVAVDEFNVIEVSEEKGLKFSVVCTLKPDVEIKNYKDFEFKNPLKKVEKKDVDERIENLRERLARLTKVEENRPIKEGDMAVLDFKGFVDGISFKGGEAVDYNLKIGSKQFIEGFEDQIIGHKVGDEFNVEVSFPENYHSKDLSGKKAIFKCKLKEIKEIELPEQDDEFAKDVSEFDSLEKLRENIEKELEKTYSDEADRKIEEAAMENLVNNVSVNLPEVMVENRYNEMLDDLQNKIKRQGMDLGVYAKYAGFEKEEDLLNDVKERAIKQIKFNLAIEKLIEIENLKVEEKELEEELEKIAEQYKMKVSDIKNIFPVKYIEKDVLNKKAREFLKNCVKLI